MTAIPMLEIERAAQLLEASEDYRVLRKFRPRTYYADETWNLGDGRATRMGLYVDCETTSLDRETAEIIELGAVPFTYDAEAGVVFAVQGGMSWFEEPKGGVPAETTKITGITEEMVRGHHINDAAVADLLRGVSLVIAHSADYDRPIMERRLPIFAAQNFACSYREVPWPDFGCVGAKLENVLAGACGEFYDAHRALDDCCVGVHCLAAARLNDRTALSYLLESARQPTTRVYAINSPFESKERLKAHRGPNGERFVWSDGTRGRRKGWYIDVKPAAAETEIAWLMESVYPGSERRHAIATEQFTAKDRYSTRAT